MQGQFIFSTCAAAGLRMRALLRNGARGGEPVAAGADMSEMKVSLEVFHAGVLEYESASFASIPYGDYAEVSDDTCPILADRRKEYLLIAHCRRGEGDQYFAQEHQLTYETGAGGRTTSLIYDAGKIRKLVAIQVNPTATPTTSSLHLIRAGVDAERIGVQTGTIPAMGARMVSWNLPDIGLTRGLFFIAAHGLPTTNAKPVLMTHFADGSFTGMHA
jgi:hypothetical protein